MRISAKGRYALSALIEIARSAPSGGIVSAVAVSEKLGVSKLFLEQIFASLKRSGVLRSAKGKNGGYALTDDPGKVSVLGVLESVETALFEKAATAGLEKSPPDAAALEALVFGPLDRAVGTCLSGVSIRDLLEHSARTESDSSFMPYM